MRHNLESVEKIDEVLLYASVNPDVEALIRCGAAGQR
jgi:hypothetical protein